ncbi:MAG TPA: hypothetical protein VI362_01415, partial [Ignavibacteriaceae bacterium]|nr:hypothetical protein [Ignavibacteriaceae bacterium]
MQKTTFKIFILLYILLIISVYPQGRSIGIFVDGGYSPGKKDTEMDKLLDKRVKDAMDAMKKFDKDSDTTKIEHKDDLIKKLENLHCICGDEVVLYMIGHGEGTGMKSSYSFHFTKDGTEITPEELRKALGKAADSCCCKISVVIFSCHSGSFLSPSSLDKDGLFNEEHVVAVFTSSLATELSYSDAYRRGGTFVDGGDWSSGFNEDWKESKAKKLIDVLIESSESAKKKMPDKFTPKEHPQGWVRGEFEIFGHVEGVRKDEKGEKIVKLKVHFYEPDFLRCTTKEIKVDGVNVPAGIKECSWIRDTVRTGKPSEPIIGISDVTATEPPTEKILAHVLEVFKDGVKVHVVSPKWLYCNNIIVKIEKLKKIDPELKPCNWTEINVKVLDPDNKEKGFTTSDSITAKDQTFNCQIHVERLVKTQNKMDIHILDPPWLNCQRYKEVEIPPGERDKMNSFDKCSNLNVDVTFHTDGSVGISNINLLTNAEGSKRFSLDAAVQQVHQLNVDTAGTFYPELNITNVGEETISFPVFVAVAKLDELNLIRQWWETGEGTPQCFWYDMVEVADLPPAETRTINFKSWQISGEESKYWVGFRTVLDGDENPSSDTTSTFLTLQHTQNNPPILQNPFVQPPAGTIQTTFIFQVTYTDADGDEPVAANVIIDNQSFQLIAGQGNITE